jgi:uncharacterized protein (DUF433 family)
LYDFRDITGERGGRLCIRGLRTVADVLGWLAAGMSEAQLSDIQS